MMQPMKLLRTLRRLEQQLEDAAANEPHEGKKVLRNFALVSAGITALALGVVIGREIRVRYKFNRRTPYDAYGHSGDNMQDMEFGVGV